jgi:hypothetical protein
VSNGQADYLLRHFPSLWEQAIQQAEDALEGNIAKPIDTGRHGQCKHGDQYVFLLWLLAKVKLP